MRKKGLLTLSLVVVALLATATQSAHAGGCLHARVRAKACTGTTTATCLGPHTACGQACNAQAFRSCFFGASEGFMHASRHCPNNGHFSWWWWASGWASVSVHGSHGHCSAPGDGTDGDDGGDVIPPPAATEVEGAFGIVDFEMVEDPDGVLILWTPGSRLQVDSTGLAGPGDISLSTIDIVSRDAAGMPIPSASGQISVILQGGSPEPAVRTSGLFDGAAISIVPVEGVFRVEFLPNDIFIPGIALEELEIRVDSEALQSGLEAEEDLEDPEDEVCICHIPPGNPGNAHTICIGESAVPAHLAHGDTLGPCDEEILSSFLDPEVLSSFLDHLVNKRHR